MGWVWSRANPVDLARYVTPLANRWLTLDENALDLGREPDGRRRLVEAIYLGLLRKNIRYALEEYHPSSQVQRIRTPPEILEAPRQGTCLDLAVLFCGICLGYELLPLLVVTEGHAFAAVSLTHSLRQRDYRPARGLFESGPLKDPEPLRRLIERDHAFLALECTGFAHSGVLAQEPTQHWPEGQGREDGVLSFARAVEAGRRQLDQPRRPFEFAIDIAVAHYDWGIEPYVDIFQLPMYFSTVGAAPSNERTENKRGLGEVHTGATSLSQPAPQTVSPGIYITAFDLNIDTQMPSFINRQIEFYLVRLFLYGCFASFVSFQWSTLVKSPLAHRIFFVFQEAFFRNERHERQPLFRVHQNVPSMLESVKIRLSQLDKANLERISYELSDGSSAAKLLDREGLPLFDSHSSASRFISRELARSITSFDLPGNVESMLLEEASFERYNTFSFVKLIDNSFSDRNDPFVTHIRPKLRSIYNDANAWSALALTDLNPIWRFEVIEPFARSIGLLDLYLSSSLSSWTELCHTMFRARVDEHFARLVNAYLKCQGPADVQALMQRVGDNPPMEGIRSFDDCRALWAASARKLEHDHG